MKIEEFKVFKNKLSNFCTASTNTWKMRILYESINNEEFYCLVDKVLDEIEGLESTKLDNLLKDIRSQTDKYIKQFDKDKNVEEQYELYTKVEVYFGLIEQINELSKLSDSIGKQLVERYGNEYVSQIDKQNPSMLTEFSLQQQEADYEDDLIKKYLVLKKWQDLQNIYCTEVLEGLFNADLLEEQYIEKVSSKLKLDGLARNLYELNKLASQNYVSIELLSKYYISGLSEKMIPIVGGKAYGLAILNTISEIPETYVIPINRELTQGLISKLDSNGRYAVRSSADCEDGVDNSFAGMFESVIDIGYSEIKEAVGKVKASIESDRVKLYTLKKGVKRPEMAVLIQLYREPENAGVWMGQTLDSGMYEAVSGNGVKLVDGSVTPYQFSGDKHKNLIDYFIGLQKRLYNIADFEWCIIGGKMVMLQYRPVTTPININPKSRDGLGVSSGRVDGEVCFIEMPEDIEKFKEGSILLTFLTDPNWVPLITKAKGVITAVGGYLCHTAIICRELSIPCITDIGIDKLSQIKNYAAISMDGNTGEIKILTEEYSK